MTLIEMNRKGCTDLLLRNCELDTYSRIDAPKLTGEDSVAVAEALIQLVQKNAINRKRIKPTYVVTMMLRGHSMDSDFIVSDEFALHFYNYYAMLSKVTHNIYNAGMEKGKSVLVGLNDGTISMSDFDKMKWNGSEKI